jgi:hypothetical protein
VALFLLLPLLLVSHHQQGDGADDVAAQGSVE